MIRAYYPVTENKIRALGGGRSSVTFDVVPNAVKY